MPFRNPILAVLAVWLSAACLRPKPCRRLPVRCSRRPSPRSTTRSARPTPMPSTRVLASSGPTLIVNGDHFTLLRGGRRVEANVGDPDLRSRQDHRPHPARDLCDPHAGRRSRRRRSPQDPRGPARTHPARRGQPRHPETLRRHARPPEADRGRLPGFPRRCGRQAQVHAFRAAGVHPRHGPARHGECHRGHPRAVGCHPRPSLGLAPRLEPARNGTSYTS